MSEYIHCPGCSEEITNDSDFCPHCGIMFAEAENVACDIHKQNQAIGVCIICRSLVCNECAVFANNRMFCRQHAEVEVQQDWALVYKSTEIADAELAKAVLEQNNHNVIVQNFNSIGFVWDGGGDSPVSRSNVNKPAKVFVPIPEYLDAVTVIEEWSNQEFPEEQE